MSIITEDSRIREILAQTRRVAVIGLSSNPDRASYGVAEALQSEGFDIGPVNPNEDKVLGENAFPDLRHVTGMVDVQAVGAYEAAGFVVQSSRFASNPFEQYVDATKGPNGEPGTAAVEQNHTHFLNATSGVETSLSKQPANYCW